MSKIMNVAESALEAAWKAGADQAQVQVAQVDVHEMNVEAHKVTLYRSYSNQNVSVKIIKDQRAASQSTNQFNDSALSNLAQQTYEGSLASPQDEGFTIAPKENSIVQKYGVDAINEEGMFAKLTDLLSEVTQVFPSTILEGVSIQFKKSKKVLLNTNSVRHQSESGLYDASVMFTSKLNGKSSSFNYTGFQMGEEKTPLLEKGGLRELIRQSVEQVHTEKLTQKFEGDLIISPHCLSDFTDMTLSYLQSGSMLKKQSFFQGKLNQQVISPLWTLRSLPVDGPFASRYAWTEDGILSKDEAIFEKGILKNYLLSQYAAKKLGERISLSQGSHLLLESGQTPLEQMISNVKKGVYLCRFSGGRPSENGDFSGVAKNSYLIEGGKITTPLSEVMVSGNLSQMLNQTQAISKESVNFGHSQFPWAHFSGLTIS